MIQTYISKLIENLPDEIKQNRLHKTPVKIDLILDGGVFNGSYLVGALYFIKEMEHMGYIKVKRVSGCSIGSIVGLLYYIDALDELPKLYELLLLDLKQHHNLNFIKTLKSKLIDKIPSNICEMVSKKLYISFNNVDNGKKIVKKSYKNVDEIFDSIIKSCYIPFIVDGNVTYQNKYMDGINPYIFKFKNKNNQHRKILYMDLLGIDKIIYSINIKNEKTNFHRILSGMLDIHNFFIKNSSTQMCSYVNDWSLHNYLYMKIRYLIEKVLIYLVFFLNIINKKYLIQWKNNLFYKFICKILGVFYELVEETNI